MAHAKGSGRLEQLEDMANSLFLVPQGGKDAVLQILKQASSLLSEMEQTSTGAAKLKPLARALVQSTLLRHRDKDVRLLATNCIMEILRAVAPEAPYSDAEMKDIFESVVVHLQGLDELTSPAFTRRMSILENLAKFKIFLVMLDMDCDELVLDMFQTFFCVVSKKQPPSVIAGMQTIMVTVLQESEVISQPLIDVLLHYLVKNTKKNSSVAHKLAAEVVEQCADKLGPYLQRLLISAMLRKKSHGSVLQEDYHNVIYEVYQCAPQMLIAVMPHLTEELLTGQLDMRIKAVQLLGGLFALPDWHVAKEYHQLFTDFMKRFTDKAVEVRLAMIECAKECIKANPSSEETREILGLNDRVLDNEDKVRFQAMNSICELAKANLKCIPMHILKNVAERLRDKKAFVRKEALQRLVEVYKSYCLNCQKGYMDEDLEWLPSRIIRCCYDKELKECRPAALELVFTEKLFPAKLPVEERTKHWIAFYSSFDENDKKALSRILLQKKRLQEEVHEYLLLRKTAKEEDSIGAECSILQKFKSMSLLFVDENKAEDCFQKLNHMKDNNIFRALVQLMDPDLTYAHCVTVHEDLLKRLSASNLQRDFTEQLVLQCSYKFFGKEHFKSVIARVAAGKNAGDQTLVEAGLSLLTEFTDIFPCLVGAIKDDLVRFLREDDGSLKERVVEVLAKAGSCIRGQIQDNSSSVELTLQNLCLEGTRNQAKHAVSALAAINNDAGFKTLSVLYGRLVKALDENNPYLPTVFQSLSCIAKHSMAVFETQEDYIIRFIVRKILRRRNDAGLEEHVGDENAWSNQSLSCQLKVFGLKTLVKSFLPPKGHPRKPFTGLVGILSTLLAKGEVSEDVKSSDIEKSHLRLASAIGVLRLAHCLDVLPPQLFHACVLIGQDPCEQVRCRFLRKLFKYLKDRSISHKFASAFALFALESSKELLLSARQYCNEFIEIVCREAKSKQTSAAVTMSSSVLTSYPEYVLTYLVHVLAHHPLFPASNTEVASNAYEPFYRMLLFYICSLIHHESDGSGKKDGVENIPAILAILRAIKKATDAVLDSHTRCLQIVCDLGILITKEFCHHQLCSETYPGQVPLPSAFYKLSDETKFEVDGDSLPLCLTKSDALAEFWSRGCRFGRLHPYSPHKQKGVKPPLEGSLSEHANKEETGCSISTAHTVTGLQTGRRKGQNRKLVGMKKRKYEVLDEDDMTEQLPLRDEQQEILGGPSGPENVPSYSTLAPLSSIEKGAADVEGRKDTCIRSLHGQELSQTDNECSDHRTDQNEGRVVMYEHVLDNDIEKTTDSRNGRTLKCTIARNEERPETETIHGCGMLELDSSHLKIQRYGSGNKRNRNEESASTSQNAHGYDSAEMHATSSGTQSHEDEGNREIQPEERVVTSGHVHDYINSETVAANNLRSPIFTLKHSYVRDDVDYSNFETVATNNLRSERIGVSCTRMSPKEGHAIGDTSDDCSKSETVVANNLRSQSPGVASTRTSQKEERAADEISCGYSSSETVRSHRIGVASTRMRQKEAKEVSETSHDYSNSETVRSQRSKVVSTRTIQKEGREGGNNKAEVNNNLVQSIPANSSDDEPMIVWRSRRRNG